MLQRVFIEIGFKDYFRVADDALGNQFEKY